MAKTCSASAAAALTAWLLVTSIAQAQTANRAWVSGHGTDAAGCGAPINPCRSLQYTHDNIVAAGGEIDILDPAGYGAITINKAISIINDGVGTAGIQATAFNAITIAAGPSDAIVLRGLDIEAVGAVLNGVEFETGASLMIEDSTVNGFSDCGICFVPTDVGRLYVSNTRVTNTLMLEGIGIHILPFASSGAVHATLEHVEADNNAIGLEVDGGNPGVKLSVTLADSLMADNTSYGVKALTAAGEGSASVMVRNTTLSNNGVAGDAEGGALLLFGHSTISGNGQAYSTTTGGVIGSYGDNNVDLNSGLGATPMPETLH